VAINQESVALLAWTFEHLYCRAMLCCVKLCRPLLLPLNSTKMHAKGWPRKMASEPYRLTVSSLISFRGMLSVLFVIKIHHRLSDFPCKVPSLSIAFEYFSWQPEYQ
jgi:hypothetical protein